VRPFYRSQLFIVRALYGCTPRADGGDTFVDLIESIYDLGNVVPRRTVEGSQADLAETLAPWLCKGIPAIVLGGGTGAR
jgi:formiminoglutamase